MLYTIAILEEVQSGIKVKFNKSGNQYQVCMYNEARKEFTSKTFDEIADALAVFQKFASSIVLGLYSYEDRRKWLQDGGTTDED